MDGRCEWFRRMFRSIVNATCIRRVLALILIGVPVAAWSQTETVLYSFTSTTSTDGFQPAGGLLLDSSGNLFGTTVSGSDTLCDLGEVNGCGIVYELVKSPNGYAEQVIYTFGSSSAISDGASPQAGLITDAAGNLYGTTTFGGSPNCLDDVGIDGCGTVFELAKSSSGYTESVLYTFTGADGAYPYAGLTIDSFGNLYGTTYSGGACGGVGTVFELVKSSAGYTEKILHSFGCTSTDGWYPYAGLVMDSAGNLYGTTESAGASGDGIVFELVNSGGDFTESVLHSFSGTDGQMPSGDLIVDSSENLYGTTQAGGEFGNGTVFELVNSLGSYTEKVLYSFKGPSYYDGQTPEPGLVMDASGNLYGNTRLGGTNCAPDGCGIAFELVSTSGTYTEEILHRFGGVGDGEVPTAPLVMDSAGNLYGTTVAGGATPCSCGAVFVVNPTATGPAAILSVPSLTFDNQPLTVTSPPQAVTVTNIGRANLIFGSSGVTVSGVNASDFAVSANTCNGAEVTPGATCSVMIAFTPSVVGTESAALNFADNAPTSPQNVALSGADADFGLAVASGTSSSATVTQGGTASYTVSVLPEGGFNQTVKLSCSGAPSGATCSANPNSLVLNGSSSSSATVTVTTTAASITPFYSWGNEGDQKLRPQLYWPTIWLMVWFLMLSVAIVDVTSRQTWRADIKAVLWRTMLAAILASETILASCGGGSGGSSGPPQNPGTPVGPYSLTITGTSGNLSHSMTLTLSVD